MIAYARISRICYAWLSCPSAVRFYQTDAAIVNGNSRELNQLVAQGLARARQRLRAGDFKPEPKRDLARTSIRSDPRHRPAGRKQQRVNPEERLQLLASGDMGQKRPAKAQSGRSQKKTKLSGKVVDGIPWTDATNEDIIAIETKLLLERVAGFDASVQADRKTQEVELKVVKTSSTGDGLAVDEQDKHVYVIPFAIEGDTVRARPYFTAAREHFSRADLLEVTASSSLRDDSRVQCRYFASCGGCHFQMMSKEDQLAHKRRVVVDAYANLSGIKADLLPEVEPTLPSPLQYGYRTKLTPHFDGPPGFSRRIKPGQPKPFFTETPPIGFMIKNRRKTMDIEECPIGSKAVQHGMKLERAKVAASLDKYSKGATILLRETTERVEKGDLTLASFNKPEVIETDSFFQTKDYITDSNAFVQEYVGESIFVNKAGAFFQNNNSILPPFIDYIKERLSTSGPKPRFLVDAYCGSGLFTISLASFFEKSYGVDIDPHSIEFATLNAARNKLPADKATFMTADAAQIFANIVFPPAETVMVIDPPRKGCDLLFLKQLMKYGPERVVYVSCNVHTQARDIGIMVNGLEGSSIRYRLESLRGCDFFPQSYHVEGVAVLRRNVS